MRSLLVCTGQHVLLDGYDTPQSATIAIDVGSGKIVETRPVWCSHNTFKLADADIVKWIDAGDNIVLPGLSHVHLNEPGRTEWEGFYTGTRAAASGGVTTLVDMPLNSIPPTTTVANLKTKREAAAGQCYVDVAFWGGVVPGNQKHLKPLVDAGVKGFKCFLIDSGVDEFPRVSVEDVKTAMAELDGLDTAYLFHAELASDASAAAHDHSGNPTHYSTFLDSRPQKLELDAVSLITSLQAAHPALRCHIVHLSASSALPVVAVAKARGLNLTVETCFHYLCLSADDIPAGRPEFKCCPPIREQANRDLLWAALQDGTIDCVVSDHSPCTAELKRLDDGDIMSAWGGISTLGLGLSLLWTEGSKRGATIADIIRWTSTKTAQHAGLSHRKGSLKAGYDGDFIIWDPKAQAQVTKESLQFKNKLSPYEGRVLNGKVKQTFLRGQLVFDAVTGFPGMASGELL
ncbi:allantoinase [Fistulina hepatica ATCC 64428]|uniref:allantoinase n=1 Tax=Fistulina hepatica ATCC 64428 TaxID=1128425 RepID=A0A0D7AJ48_9AGAR|nr:allantoinase [Fistulina hepatica ATCC 64428]